MKATPKQLIFLGVFSLAVVVTCAVVGYRAVAPSPRSRGASASRTARPASESSPRTERQPTGWRSSYRPSSPIGAASGQQGRVQGREAAEAAGNPTRLAAGNRASNPSRPAPTLDKPALVTYSLEDYLTIAERDPFKPIAPPPQPKPTAVRGAASFNGFPKIPAPVVVSNANPNTSSPAVPPTPPAPPPPPLPSTPPPTSAAESPKDIAVTGFVQSPEGWFILIENVTTQEARRVGLGEEEFGYRIQSIDVAKKRVVLEKDGQQIQLRIGDNKKEVRPEKKAPEATPPSPQGGGAPTRGGGPPGFGGGFPGFGGGMPGFGGPPPTGDTGANPWGQMFQGFQNWQRGGGRRQR